MIIFCEDVPVRKGWKRREKERERKKRVMREIEKREIYIYIDLWRERRKWERRKKEEKEREKGGERESRQKVDR